VLAPAATPRDIVARLSAELAKIVRQPDMRERMSGEGGEAVGSTPEEFAEYLKAEMASSAKLVNIANLRAE
jgi:tripartite-type tricarboxylate transporter receptor subunit TctC